MKRINKIVLYLPLLLGLFFLRFPPIYYLGVHSTILTTHVLSGIIFVNYFLVFLYWSFKSEKIFPKTSTYYVILIFIITQSISVFGAIDGAAFMQRYSKYLVGFIVFFSFSVFLDSQKKDARNLIMYTLFFGALVGLFFQFLIFFNPSLYFSVGEIFIYDNELDITRANFENNKLFDATFIWIVIPIIMYLLLETKKIVWKFMYSLSLVCFGFIAFASNFRYAFITFITFTIISYLVLRGKLFITTFKKELLAIVICFLGLIIVYQGIVSIYNDYSIIDRLLIRSSDKSDYRSIQWRFEMAMESIDMGLSSPLIGVGLGNFYDNLRNYSKQHYTYDYNIQAKITEGGMESGPHNIFFQTFAETGFIGLIGLLGFLAFFAVKDYYLLKSNNNNQRKIFMLSFWTLVLISQAFPPIILSFYVLFFLLRAAAD